VLRKFKFWRLRRKLTHSHFIELWPPGSGTETYKHSHLEPDIDHSHTIDECCRRDACREFPLHRVHPRSVKR
jgi:hypothetical protein